VHPRKSIRDLFTLAGSQYLVRILLIARGFIAARLLGPAAYGAWNAVVLVIEYGAQSQLGSLQGLDQTVPGRIVDQDRRGLDQIKRAALFNILLGGALYALLCLGYFTRSQGQLRASWGLFGIGLAVACALLTNLSNYHTSILRSHGRIEIVSLWWVIQGLIGAVLGVALIPAFGAWGLLWGWFAGTLAAMLFVRVVGRNVAPIVPRPGRAGVKLLSVGLPMFLYVGLNFVLRSLDRVMILRFLGTEHLGFYSLAVMAIGLLLYLPDSAGYVMYPRLLGRYHASGDDPEAIREPVHQVLGAVSIVLPALCALAYLAADDSVLWLLPKFREGVPSLRILCFGAAALGLGNLCAIVLMVLRRHQLLVPAALASLGLGSVAMLLAIRFGFGIRGVAWATLGAYTFHSSLMLWLALGRLHEDPAHRLLTLARLLAPLAIALPIAYACNVLMPSFGNGTWPTLLRLLAGVAGFLVAYGLAVRPLGRGLGLRQLVRETRVPVPSWLRTAASRGPSA
jgi:O-antigen/teichoic acid export membrane protein